MMQEGTDDQGISDEWAELMFQTYEVLKYAEHTLDLAEQMG